MGEDGVRHLIRLRDFTPHECHCSGRPKCRPFYPLNTIVVADLSVGHSVRLVRIRLYKDYTKIRLGL